MCYAGGDTTHATAGVHPAANTEPQNVVTSDLPHAQWRMPRGNYGVGGQIPCMSTLHPLVVMAKMPRPEKHQITRCKKTSLCIAVADVGRCRKVATNNARSNYVRLRCSTARAALSTLRSTVQMII